MSDITAPGIPSPLSIPPSSPLQLPLNNGGAGEGVTRLEFYFIVKCIKNYVKDEKKKLGGAERGLDEKIYLTDRAHGFGNIKMYLAMI